MKLEEVVNRCSQLSNEFYNCAKTCKSMDYYDEILTPNEYRQKADEYKQIVDWLSELIEAKKLLKIALEDMNTLYESGKDEGCLGIKFKWRYEDEVMKLLGDDKDVSINEN